MNRAQLEHAIRAASNITGVDQVFVIGSQSILGSYSEDELPEIATLSDEADIWVLGDDDTKRLSEKLLAIGELSSFHEMYGFYVDGVSSNTASLPHGWDQRLVEVRTERSDGTPAIGLCLEPHDLCIAKLVANRPKDQRFVRALVHAGLVDANVLLDRLTHLTPPIDRVVRDGETVTVERDINYAWVEAQTLVDEQRKLHERP